MEDYVLSEDEWDPDWSKTKAPDPEKGLKFSQSQTVSDWIILLEFTQGDSGTSHTANSCLPHLSLTLVSMADWNYKDLHNS